MPKRTAVRLVKPVPRYVALAAVTVDGKIAKNPQHFSNWTSPEDKVFLRRELSKSDVIIVGRNTYETAKKPLSKRNCIVLTSKVRTISVEAENLVLVNPKTVNLKTLIRKLGYVEVAVLGGAQTYQYCLDRGLLDEIYLTIEPLTFSSGINLFSSDKPKVRQWNLVSVKKLNHLGTILLHYRRAGV